MCPSNDRVRLGVLALAVCLLQVRPGRADEELYRQVASSTAVVYKSTGQLSGGVGTGFLIDTQERLLVTARHVVENTNGGIAVDVFVIFPQTRDGEIITEAAHYRNNWQTVALKGKVIYESVRRDMAVIQVEKLPAGIKPLQLADSKARPGQAIHLVGNFSERFGAVFSYCQGYVRNVFHWEELGARVVATQLPANKGDSGGPMVNNLGAVVGFAFMSTTGGPLAKNSIFHELQVTELSICVTEIRAGLEEMRNRLLAKGDNPARPRSQKALAFQGEAKVTVQAVLMEKDVLYRLMVKAEGFVPEMRIDNILVPVTTSAQGLGHELQHLFIPKETKEYRLQVGPWPGRDIGKGSLPYTLTVDRVAFEPETAFKEPQLKLNEHVLKFEAGKTYDIAVKGKGFEPDVQIVDETRTVLMKFNYGNRGTPGTAQRIFEAMGMANAEFETTLRFVAGKTKEYRILIAVSGFSPPRSGPLNYTMKITEQKVFLSVRDQLTGQDPLYPQAGPFKIHLVKLEAGKSYQIDLITTAFDSRLLLEDSAGKVVMQGFDVEGFNGRLIFRPTKTDTYRVVATAHRVDARGPYAVTVAESPGAQPVLPGGNKIPAKDSK